MNFCRRTNNRRKATRVEQPASDNVASRHGAARRRHGELVEPPSPLAASEVERQADIMTAETTARASTPLSATFLDTLGMTGFARYVCESSRFKNASCLYEPPLPNLTTTAFCDGRTYSA